MLVNAGVSKLSYIKRIHGNKKSEGTLMRLFHVFPEHVMAMLPHRRRLARIGVTDEAISCMLLVTVLKWESALAIYG